MSAGDGLAVVEVGQEHPGANDVARARPKLLQSGDDYLEAAPRLDLRIGVARAVGPDRRGAGYQHAITDPDGAADADPVLIRRARRNAPPLGHQDRCLRIRSSASVRRPSGAVSEMRKKPSPLGPYIEPGEITTAASSSTSSANEVEVWLPGTGAQM